MRYKSKIKRNSLSELKGFCSLIANSKRDHEYEENHGQVIFYAIDTNIVKAYCQYNEEENYLKDNGYQIFKNSDLNIAKKLRNALSVYIFSSFRKKRSLPLLMFDPHFEEIDRIYNKLVDRSSSTSEYQELIDQLMNIFNSATECDESNKDTTSNEEKKNNLKLAFDNYYKVYEASPCLINEINLLEKLISGKDYKFCGKTALLKHYPEIAKKIPFPQPETKSHHDFLNLIQDFLTDELENKKRALKEKQIIPNRKPYNRSNDISVLLNLFYINYKLLESGDKARLILISDDYKIKEGADILSKLLHKNHEDKYHKDKQNSFSDLYIRHPLSFLSEKDFIGNLESLIGEQNLDSNQQPEIKEFNEITSLFETLLPKKPLNKQPEEKPLDWLPPVFDEFLRKRLFHPSFEYSTENYEQRIVELKNKINSTHSGHDFLREIVNEANDLIIKETNLLSFNLQKKILEKNFESNSAGALCFRMSPFIRIEVLDSAKGYFKQNYLLAQETVKNIENLTKLRKGENSLNYITALNNAVLWAFLDNWEYVQKNSGRACKILLNLIAKKRNSEVSLALQEASYLNAVATRHLIKYTDRADFTKAIRGLQKNAQYFQNLLKESKNNKNSNYNHRFKLELLFIEWMECWYYIFHSEITELPLEEITNLIDIFCRIKMDFFNIFKDINKEIESIIELEQLDHHRLDYLIYILRHAAMGYCMISITLDYHDELKSHYKENNNDQVKFVITIYIDTENKLKAKLNENLFKDNSLFFSTTMLISKLLYADIKNDQQNEIYNDLCSRLTPENIKKYSRKPYEKGRYLFFCKVMKKWNSM